MSATDFAKHKIPTLAGLGGAILAKKAITAAYGRGEDADPPVDPSVEGVRWRDAITWTAALASGAAVGRLLARFAAGKAVNRAAGPRVAT